MLPFKPYLISKRVVRTISFGILVIFTLLTIVSLNLLEIPSFAIANPDSTIHQTSHAQELITQSPVPNNAQPTPIASPTISPSDTALLFQNDRYAVRIFWEGEQAYINVYDKANQVQPHAGLAILLVTLNFPNLDYVKGGIINTLITYALVTAIVTIPYTIWRKRSLGIDAPSMVVNQSNF